MTPRIRGLVVVRRIAHRLGFVFVHGCFWHRHEGCRFACEPETRIGSWSEKFNRNVARDRDNEEALRALGWRVLVIWECEIRNLAALEECLLDYLRWSHDEAGQSVT